MVIALKKFFSQYIFAFERKFGHTDYTLHTICDYVQIAEFFDLIIAKLLLSLYVVNIGERSNKCY
jgi:hypothetical protein